MDLLLSVLSLEAPNLTCFRLFLTDKLLILRVYHISLYFII